LEVSGRGEAFIEDFFINGSSGIGAKTSTFEVFLGKKKIR